MPTATTCTTARLRYFSLVALNFTDTTALDRAITADLRRNHHYRIVRVIPCGTEVPPIGLGTYVIWQYQPDNLTGPRTSLQPGWLPCAAGLR